MLTALLGRRRLILSTAALLAAAGLAAWLTMIRQEDPAFPYRYGFVMVQYPGADVELTERLVADPLEEELTEVEQVDELRTTIRAGFVFVLVALKQTVYDTDTAWDRIRVAVDRAVGRFPPGTLPPVVDDRQIDAATVVLALTGSDDPVMLQQAARDLRQRLYGLKEIARIRIYGDAGEQVTVALDDHRLATLALAPDTLAATLQGRNEIVPGGYLTAAGRQLQIRPHSEFRSIDEIAATPIHLPGGGNVSLGTLADVRLEVRDPPTETAWIGTERAVVLAVIAERNRTNAVAFGQRLRHAIDGWRGDFAPLRIEEMFYQPARVAERLSELGRSLLLGVAIVGVLLLLAMGWRLGLTVTSLVPLVTFAALALYALGGGVLHQMAVAGMVIALGLLVDNAIVMAENIHWHLNRGAARREAAVCSVRELAGPLGAATGTTVAVFVPMLASSGDTADFTRALPVVIILMLVVSYLFAVLVTPLAGEVLLRPAADRATSRLAAVGRRLGGLAVRRPWLVTGSALLAVLLSVAASRYVERNFFPETDRNQFVVDVYFPEGTPLAITSAAAHGIAAQIAARPGVRRTFTFIGNSGPRFYYNLNETPRAPHIARLAVETATLADIAPLFAWIREQAGRRWLAADVVPRRLAQGPPQPAPVEIRLVAGDGPQLVAATEALLAHLRAIAGTANVRHDLGIGQPMLEYRIDDARADLLATDRRSVGQALARQTQGVEIGTYRGGDDPAPIILRSPAGERLAPAELATVHVWGQGGEATPLVAVADERLYWQPAVRHHFNLQPAVNVFSELEEGVTYAAVFKELYRRLAVTPLPAGVELVEGGAQESSGEANQALFHTLPLGILLLLFFLLLQFNSFRRVAIILSTVPLAAAGVVPGLILSGYPFGFMAMLGLIALVGIVVNNAIVLIDVTDAALAAGRPVDEALSAAVERRIRPVLLTTATTVAGLMPLTLTRSTLWPPMAWTMISGLTVSTLLTLLVVPALMKLALPARPIRTAPPAAPGSSIV